MWEFSKQTKQNRNTIKSASGAAQKIRGEASARTDRWPALCRRADPLELKQLLMLRDSMRENFVLHDEAQHFIYFSALGGVTKFLVIKSQRELSTSNAGVFLGNSDFRRTEKVQVGTQCCTQKEQNKCAPIFDRPSARDSTHNQSTSDPWSACESCYRGRHTHRAQTQDSNACTACRPEKVNRQNKRPCAKSFVATYTTKTIETKK